jgi:hypothetical protein
MPPGIPLWRTFAVRARGFVLHRRTAQPAWPAELRVKAYHLAHQELGRHVEEALEPR